VLIVMTDQISPRDDQSADRKHTQARHRGPTLLARADEVIE
jgi:hypothetical protein